MNIEIEGPPDWRRDTDNLPDEPCRSGYEVSREGTGDLYRQIVVRQYGEHVGAFATVAEAHAEITAQGGEIPEPAVFGCTCCDAPRPARFDLDAEQWVHTDDDDGDGPSEASMLHVHVESSGQDCDGLLQRFHVTRPTQLRGDSELSHHRVWLADGTQRTVYEVHDFWPHLVAMQVYPWATDGKNTVEISAHDGDHRFEQRRATDEGWHNDSMYTCRSPECAFEKSSQRDHAAEAAGY